MIRELYNVDDLPKTVDDLNRLVSGNMHTAIAYVDGNAFFDAAKKIGFEDSDLDHLTLYKACDAYDALNPEQKNEFAEYILPEVALAMAGDYITDAGRDMGLFYKPETYLSFSNGNTYDYELKFVYDGVDLLNSFCSEDFSCHICDISREDDKPYLEAFVSSPDAPTGKIYRLVPMSWMRAALASDVRKNIEEVMIIDHDVRDAVREAVPSLVEGKSDALLAVEDYLLLEAFEAKDRKSSEMISFEEFDDINRDIAYLSLRVASFDFLKFKKYVEDVEKTDSLNSRQLFDLATDGFVRKNDSFQLPGKVDSQLADGIQEVLRFGDNEDIRKMVDGLFGKDRVNTIHELKTMGSREQSR